MGAEAKCTARCQGRQGAGTARLETDPLQFRGGELKLSIPFKAMTDVAAVNGALRVTTADGKAVLDLGAAAMKWAEKIRHPPSRLQKLGVKPDWRVSAIGLDDEQFLR